MTCDANIRTEDDRLEGDGDDEDEDVSQLDTHDDGATES